MSIAISTSDDGSQITIAVSGRFDFSLHRHFRNAYAGRPSGTAYCVDLNGVEYMDSSALGMLLLLRDHAGGERSRVVPLRPQPRVRRIPGVANFDKLFQLG